ncbi:MAG TPA: peptide ABC transporter substrate-binding protein [Opitutaceae bacterium]
MKLFRRFPVLTILGCVALGLSGCSRRETQVDAGVRTQTLLYGNAAEPADLDPHVIIAFTDSQIAYALFEGLTRLDAATNAAVPAAAESWDVSPDGKVYTFHVRPTARWSNGDPVTAADFAYSFHRILTPAFGSLYSYMLWPIKNAEAFNSGKITDFSLVGVKALDTLTLQVTLEKPTPYLPALASHTTWLPVHQASVEKFGRMEDKGTKWTLPGNLVGNGAFTLAEWIPNARIAVVKNPLYWDAAHTRLNRVEFYPIEKPDIEELNYRSGQLHSTYDLPTSKIEAYRAHQPPDFKVDPVLSTFYLFLNTKRAPFDNVKLRQALSHGLDREELSRDITKGVFPVARSLTPPNCGGYTSRTQVSDDFELARRLMAEAGYPGGKGLPTVEVQCYETEVPLRMLEAIQAMWLKELGFHITIAQIEQKTLFQNQQNRNYTMSFSGWIADYPDPLTFLGMMITDGGNNWASWSNKEFDRLIDETTNTADNAKRLEIFQKAEVILLDEAPIIPLYFRPQVYARSPDVHGWTTNVVGFHQFNTMWLEK